jgi:topoisomerase-4 subunit A
MTTQIAGERWCAVRSCRRRVEPVGDNGGKGNKLIEIPRAKLAQGERVAGVAVVAEGRGEVTLYAGARKLILKWSDLPGHNGNRAQRGG